MTINVGNLDRVFRALGAIAMAACAFLAPLPLAVRAPLFGVLAAYMSFTALAGTCLGYKLMGDVDVPGEDARVMGPHGDLLAAAAGGDDEALSRLVHAYHDRVARFGLRVCRDGYDADDAVQEAFLQLARHPEVAQDQGALAWLYTVVKNACLRLLRPFARERRALGERVSGADDADPAALDPQQAFERWELVRSVHAAIAALDPPLREVLVLRDLEGLSGEETSAALGLPLPAMKSRLHRARTELREALRSAPGARTNG